MIDLKETSQAIADIKNYTEILTDYTLELKERSRKSLKELSDMRGIPVETLEKCGIFYIGEQAEMLIPKFLPYISTLGVISETNKKPIFTDRWVIPICDTDGNVLNLVGYKKDAQERYVYGTARYYDRTHTLWGLQNMKRAYELGYFIVTEGITDAIRVMSLGYEPVFAQCGTVFSQLKMVQLNRCRHGGIEIPDRDKAGQSAAKKWECNRYIRLNTFIAYKDIDEMCASTLHDNISVVKQYLDFSIDRLKEKEHCGMKTDCEIITIV